MRYSARMRWPCSRRLSSASDSLGATGGLCAGSFSMAAGVEDEEEEDEDAVPPRPRELSPGPMRESSRLFGRSCFIPTNQCRSSQSRNQGSSKSNSNSTKSNTTKQKHQQSSARENNSADSAKPHRDVAFIHGREAKRVAIIAEREHELRRLLLLLLLRACHLENRALA